MKIVHAVYSMELGGAEMLVAQLGRVQRAAGHDVTVCAYSRLGPLGEVLRDEGLAVHVMGEAPVAKTILRYLQLFRKMRPDVVHCHNPAPTLQAAIGARLSGAKCIVATRHSLVSPPYDRAAEIKFSLVARCFVDAVTGICQITCDNLRGAPLADRGSILRVYNGAAPLEAAVSIPSGNDEFVLLFVGRLAEVKDLPTMLRAFALAVAREPRLRLWIVGDGGGRARLQGLAEELGLGERVRFWGQRLDTAAFFRAAGAFVMSSLSEGLPMSLLQAMSIGLPAIVTDVGGMAEVLKLSGGGLRVPPGNADAMAEAMVRMFRDEEARRTFGENALTAYETHFTLQQMAAAYEAVYARSRGSA